MREKLQTLPLAELKELAKAQGIKGGSTMRKAELIDALCMAAEQEEIIKTAVAPPSPKPQAEIKNDDRNNSGIKPQRVTKDNRQPDALTAQEIAELDSGIGANGILEVMPDGFGFIRCENFLPGENDVYVPPQAETSVIFL